MPRTGPVIFISNHQSYLDPVVNGVATRDRQVGFLAKVELFGFSATYPGTRPGAAKAGPGK